MVAGRMALAFHPGGYSGNSSWDRHGLLSNGLAFAGPLASSGRAGLAYQRIEAELQAKKKIRDYTIAQAFCDRRILLLIAAFFLALSGSLGNIYWIPTFVKRLSGFSDRASDFAANSSSSDWYCRDAQQRLALR